MPRLTPLERERVIEMLQANITSLVIAQQFRCHFRTIEHLRNFSDKIELQTLRVQDVSSVQSILFDNSDSQGQISAQTVRNRFREIGVRPDVFYVCLNITLTRVEIVGLISIVSR